MIICEDQYNIVEYGVEDPIPIPLYVYDKQKSITYKFDLSGNPIGVTECPYADKFKQWVKENHDKILDFRFEWGRL